jgi:hypothetical protein
MSQRHNSKKRKEKIMSDKDLTIAGSKDIAPAYLGGYTGGTGFENISNECISFPFLRLAQTNTPQATNGSKDYLDGLSPGKYFNPTTGRIYHDATFIILGFFRNFSVWKGEPPDAKFVRSITPEDFTANYESRTRPNDKGKIVDADGNRYVDTRNFLVLSAEHPEDGILLYGMASTAIPPSKKWLAKASAIRVKDADGNIAQAPMWARVWQLKPAFQDKPNGKYWQVTDIADKGWIDPSLAASARVAFEEAQNYDKSRISAVDKAPEEDTPEWAK